MYIMRTHFCENKQNIQMCLNDHERKIEGHAAGCYGLK